MNIFYLSEIPQRAAQYHHNAHCLKMVLETAQLLSTAHRLLDGTKSTIKVLSKKTGKYRNKKIWTLPDPHLEKTLYSATHINHPSAEWVRSSDQAYRWTTELLAQLCKEYTYRYGKIHKVERSGLLETLFSNYPTNIKKSNTFTQPPCAMPESCKVSSNAVDNYRTYYNQKKQFNTKGKQNKYKKRQPPDWLQWKECAHG